MVNLWETKKRRRKCLLSNLEILINDESDKLIEQDKIIKAAKLSTENNGIVLDEIDKISARTDRVGGDVSRKALKRFIASYRRNNRTPNMVQLKLTIFYLLHQVLSNLQSHLIHTRVTGKIAYKS